MDPPWNRPDEYDHTVVVADDEAVLREAIRELLAPVPGRDRAAALGRYPRFRVLLAGGGEEAVRLVSPDVSALAVSLAMPQRDGLQVVEAVRQRRRDVAILCFARAAAAPPRDAVAAIRAGADHFVEYADGPEILHGLEAALDRRRLAMLIARSETELEEARERLARLGGDLTLGLPGLRPPASVEAVIPFQDAARQYLAAAAKLFDGDPRGLADRLGISYFALRRLLKRYEVPFPGRARRNATRT